MTSDSPMPPAEVTPEHSAEQLAMAEEFAHRGRDISADFESELRDAYLADPEAAEALLAERIADHFIAEKCERFDTDGKAAMRALFLSKPDHAVAIAHGLRLKSDQSLEAEAKRFAEASMDRLGGDGPIALVSIYHDDAQAAKALARHLPALPEGKELERPGELEPPRPMHDPFSGRAAGGRDAQREALLNELRNSGKYPIGFSAVWQAARRQRPDLFN